MLIINNNIIIHIIRTLNVVLMCKFAFQNHETVNHKRYVSHSNSLIRLFLFIFVTDYYFYSFFFFFLTATQNVFIIFIMYHGLTSVWFIFCFSCVE